MNNIENLITYNYDDTCKYFDSITSEITKILNVNDASETIFESMYLINCIYSYVGMRLLLSKNSPWKLLNEKIENYTKSLFTNIKFKQLINSIKSDNKEINIWIKTINNKIKSYDENINKLKILINDHIQNIFKILNKPIYYNKILLNNINYLQLIKKIKTPSTREIIEKKYNSNTYSCEYDLSQIIILRNQLAKLNDATNYFEFIKKNIEKVTDMITALNNKIEQFVSPEIKKIFDKQHEKLSSSDITYHKFSSINKKFSLKQIINKILHILSNLLNIKSSKTSLNFWKPDIPVLNFTYNNKNIGYLFLDVINNKQIFPLFIKLISKYNTIIPKAILMASFTDWTSEILSYNDVYMLCKEFGLFARFIISNTSIGIIFNENELIDLLPLIIFKRFYINDIEDIDKIYMIKQKCITALFDHIIHTSSTFIDGLKTNYHDLFDLYKKLYNSILNKQKIYLNLNMPIDQSIILKEINGSETSLYESIISEIFSNTLLLHNIYELFTNNSESLLIEIQKFLTKYNIQIKFY